MYQLMQIRGKLKGMLTQPLQLKLQLPIKIYLPVQSGKLYGNVSIHSVHLSPCTLVLQEHTPKASQPSDPCSSQPHAENIGCVVALLLIDALSRTC